MGKNKVEHPCSTCYFVEYSENNIKKITNMKYKSIAEFELFLSNKCLVGKVVDYKLIEED